MVRNDRPVEMRIFYSFLPKLPSFSCLLVELGVDQPIPPWQHREDSGLGEVRGCEPLPAKNTVWRGTTNMFSS